MRRVLWFVALSGLLLSACSDNTNVADELAIDRQGFTAYFDLTAGILPFPTNLLFSGSTDGTLNIPVADPEDFSDPRVAMNALDGFSTVAPISTRFSGAIDPGTLSPANVRIFEVTLTGVGGAVTSIIRELAFGLEFFPTLSSVDPTTSTLVILPTSPLKPRTSYLVVLTDGIKGAAGQNPQISAHYLIAKTPNSLIGTPAAALEPVRLLVNAQEAALAGQGVDSDSIILSWTFTTQSTEDVLLAAKTLTTGTAAVIPVSVGTTAALLGAGPGIADVYVGTLGIPYYLDNADVSPLAPLGTFWQGAGGSNLSWINPAPIVKSNETIPLLLSLPNHIEQPDAGWPVVIYQHGLTTNRTTMLAIADAMASAGFAVVAIDLPLHGLPPGHPLYAAGMERTFDLDFVNNETGAPGPDGIADSSGTHFMNLRSLLTFRDNGRQAVADLFALTEALRDLGFGGNFFDANDIYFVGHSTGGMMGSIFLALEPGVNSAVLGMVGGGIAKLLDGSVNFGPRIEAGLAASGILKGTADYESFMGAMQTVADSVDPINYTAGTITGRGVLMFEVIGDQTVPNNVMADAPAGTVPSPLAGTAPLAALMGLTQVSATTDDVDLALVRFISGDHGSLLNPAADPVATAVMQGAAAAFLASDGTLVLISDESVVE